jgi:hypothetical protein
MVLFQKSLVGNKNSQQNTQHSRKGTAAILTRSPYKNRLQENRKRKETRDQRKSAFKIRLQKKRQSGPCDANVSAIRGEHEVTRKKTVSESSSSDPEDCEEPSFVETGEENSDTDAECFYCSGLYTRDTHGEKWIECTKCYKWCHEECSGTDDWKTFLCFVCNTQ